MRHLPRFPAPRLARAIAMLAAAAVATAAAATPAKSEGEALAGEGPGGREFLRGMTVSCPGYGEVWGSPLMAESLRELRELGVRWVAIHPYAAVDRAGAVRFRPARERGYLARAVRMAEEAGVELFWKPHLAYWGSFAWRGDVEFGDDETRWRRFFDGYRAFIVDQARFAEEAGVRLFAVGVELEATTGREAEWRRIVADVRRVYSGRLTYAANWDRLERVPFWDAVDLVGVQAYFPLAGEADPPTEALRRGWDAPLGELRRLSERHRRPILFAEIGYDLSGEAARSPWLSRTRDTPRNRALRERLIRVALERLEGESHLAGMFWWKWIPGRRADRDFSMRHPETRELLRAAWGR